MERGIDIPNAAAAAAAGSVHSGFDRRSGGYHALQGGFAEYLHAEYLQAHAKGIGFLHSSAAQSPQAGIAALAPLAVITPVLADVSPIFGRGDAAATAETGAIHVNLDCNTSSGDATAIGAMKRSQTDTAIKVAADVELLPGAGDCEQVHIDAERKLHSQSLAPLDQCAAGHLACDMPLDSVSRLTGFTPTQQQHMPFPHLVPQSMLQSLPPPQLLQQSLHEQVNETNVHRTVDNSEATIAAVAGLSSSFGTTVVDTVVNVNTAKANCAFALGAYCGIDHSESISDLEHEHGRGCDENDNGVFAFNANANANANACARRDGNTARSLGAAFLNGSTAAGFAASSNRNAPRLSLARGPWSAAQQQQVQQVGKHEHQLQ